MMNHMKLVTLLVKLHLKRQCLSQVYVIVVIILLNVAITVLKTAVANSRKNMIIND